MSGLVYTGDAVKAFGKFMPSLVIEKVYIYDSSLKVRTAIYLPSSTDEAPSDEYLNALESSLNFYGVMVFDASNVNAIINGSTTILSSIVNNAELITDDATFPVHSNFEQIIPNLTNTEPEIVYDNSENMLFKYSFETDIYPLHTAETFNSRLRSMSQNTLLKYGTLCCFATTYDLSETTKWIESFNNLVSTTNDPLVGHPIYLPDAPTALIKRNIGDVTYENVFINGALNEDSLVAYTTPTGEFYTGPVLKSLDGTDYEAGNIKPSDIQASMRGLLDQYSPTDVETEVELAGVANSVSYIAQTGANNSLVVSELNKVRKSFPKRGGATKTGRFYNDLSTTLSSINTKIQSNAKLKKVLYKNAKLVDARTFGTLNVGWVAPETNAELQEEVIYSDLFITREIYKIPEQWDTENADALNWGYFFFDMEKVLHRDTYIAEFLDVAKVDKLFGTGLINSSVKLSALKLEKKDETQIEEASGFIELGNLMTFVKFNIDYAADTVSTVEDNHWPKVADATYASDPGQGTSGIAYDSYGEVSQGYGGGTDYSYVALRAIQLTQEQGLYSQELGHDYRLMGFEFQDYYETMFLNGDPDELVGTAGREYEVEIKVWDYSAQTLYELNQNIQDLLPIFQDYRDVAADYCNYNDEGGYFNSFFEDSMASTYGGNLSQAPWILVPMTFAMYVDLLDNTASKPIEQLIEDASLISEKISPSLGSLEEIERFQTQLQAVATELDAIVRDAQMGGQQEFTYGVTLTYNQTLDISQIPIYISALPPLPVDPNTGAQLEQNLYDTLNFEFGVNFTFGESGALNGDIRHIIYYPRQDSIANNDFSATAADSYADMICDFVEENDRGIGHGAVSQYFWRHPSRNSMDAVQKGDEMAWVTVYENPLGKSGPFDGKAYVTIKFYEFIDPT